MFLVLAVPEVPVMESAMCVCVFITAVPMKKLFAWGDWCECVCLLIIFFCSESLLLDRCCCSTGVCAGALGSESTL